MKVLTDIKFVEEDGKKILFVKSVEATYSGTWTLQLVGVESGWERVELEQPTQPEKEPEEKLVSKEEMAMLLSSTENVSKAPEKTKSKKVQSNDNPAE